jgi:hypothetical protein
MILLPASTPLTRENLVIPLGIPDAEDGIMTLMHSLVARHQDDVSERISCPKMVV